MASVAIKTLSTGTKVYYAQVKRNEKWTWFPTGIEAKGKSARQIQRERDEAVAAAKEKQAEIDEEAKNPPKPDEPAPEVKLCKPLLGDWIKSLDNRAKREDEWRARKYLFPRFGDLPIRAVTKAEVIRWLDELAHTKIATRTRDGKTIEGKKVLSGASQKKLFTLLSRFLSWASARDYIDANPCRNVPTLERPQEDGKQRKAWLADEEKVRAITFALGPAYGLMFATARTGGLRLCEVAGLRLADTDALEEGVLHVRYSYDMPMLKEDKGRSAERKTKWAPIHDATVAASLLALALRRRDAGAKDEDRLFDHLPAKPNAIRVACARAWRDAAAAAGGVDGLGWYESSRHSFASKALASGAKYEEVSKALGHSSVNTTARYYDRHVERAFKSLPKTDMGAALPDGKVLQLPTQKAARIS